MSPLQIRILLHYHSHIDDYAGGELGSFVNELVNMDMLERACESKRYWKLTNRATAYIEYILNVPLPIQEWKIKMPEQLTNQGAGG